MYLLQATPGFTWKEILLGGEEWSFLLETVLRSFIMFVIILVSLRILGKRGVKQLSVFELVVILGLGSAAADPMFYKDVGILPALIVFAMVVGLYSCITYLVGKNKKFEVMVEGKPVCLIKEGVFSINDFKKEALGEEEFFAELRLKSVSQLGQIEEAIIEISGEISIFYYPDEAVKYGLPIMQKPLDASCKVITDTAHYSCIFCGYTKELQPISNYNCALCKKNEWIKSSNKKRIA